MSPLLTAKVQAYLDRLIADYPEISSIWLYGSRANCQATDSSDCDILIFADRRIFGELAKRKDFIDKDMDLLVVYDGDKFEQPWPRPEDEATLKGSLTELKWEQTSNTTAKYYGANKAAWDDDSDDGELTKESKAIRIWPSAYGKK